MLNSTMLGLIHKISLSSIFFVQIVLQNSRLNACCTNNQSDSSRDVIGADDQIELSTDFLSPVNVKANIVYFSLEE